MPAIPIALAAASVYSTVKGADQARKSANQANDAAKAAKVDPAAVSQAAEQQALRNIELSRATELKNNPENAALRTGSINNLIAMMGQGGANPQLQALLGQIGNQGSTYGGDVTAGRANSELLNQAIAKAQSDLALGGDLPLDVRNLVARNAAAKAGGLGNIRLGGDISARDLGLTSLDLANRRLSNAQALGQAQLGADQFNNQLAQQAGIFNSGQRQQAGQFGQGYMLNQAQLLQSLANGDYAKALSAAQFGQSLQTPVVGLDPSAVANLYVGNQNAGTAAGLQAAQIGAAQAQGSSQLGGSLLGAGLGGLANYYGNKTAANAGIGAKTTYADYLAANPYSSAAIGQQN